MKHFDSSSAHNIMIPRDLVCELALSWVKTMLCNWLLDFLTEGMQSVQGGVISPNTGTPQGCLLSPLSFKAITSACCPSSNTNHILKYADSITVVGLVKNNNKVRETSDPEHQEDKGDHYGLQEISRTKFLWVYIANYPSHLITGE